MAPKLKLTYFDAPGRAELTRLILKYGKIDFTDERISGEEFGKIKSSLPYSQLPVLEIDDNTVIAQSFTMARYAAKLSGLYPENSVEAAKADMIVDAIKDVFEAAIRALFVGSEEQKAQAKKTLIEEIAPKLLSGLEKGVRGNYFLGQDISYADIALFDALTLIPAKFPQVSLKNYPKLNTIYERVAANDNIAAYRKTRE